MDTFKRILLLASLFIKVSAQNTADCIGAQPVCNNPNFNFVATPNNGNINELPGTNSTSNPAFNPASNNMGCLLAGENNPQWLLVNVTVGGMLEFSFGAAGSPNPQVGLYDWAMWPYTPTTCNDIINNILPPVRCNWNAIGNGGTGIGTVPPGGSQGNFEPALPVVAGQQFVICISNFSGVNTTVTFTSTGTAQIGCHMIQANSATVCPNQPAQITPTLTNLLNATLTIQPGNQVINTPTFTLSTPVSQVYTITANGFNNNNQAASASTTLQIAIIPTQVLALPPANNFCIGQQASMLTPPGYVSYTLSSLNGYYSAAPNNSFSLGIASPSIAGNYTLQVQNNSGCLFSGTTQVNAIQAQVPQIVGAALVCQQATLQLSANVPAAVSFTWQGPNALLQQGANLQIPTIQPIHAGVYTLQATSASNGAICVGTNTVEVKVNPVFPVSISPSQTLCLGTTIQMSALAPNAVNYHWMGPNAFNQAGSLVTISNAQANQSGIYKVNAHFILNNLTCYSSATTSIYLDQAPTLTLEPLYTFCQGSEIKIIPPGGANHYQWSGPNNFIHPAAILSIPNALPQHGGSYTLQVQSIFDCKFIRTVPVYIIPALELKISPSDLVICKFKEAPNTTSVVGGSGNYQFTYIPMNGITHLSGGLAYFSPQASMQYTVMVTDPACPTTKISKSFWVTVRNLPEAQIVSDVKEGCVPLKVKLQSLVHVPTATLVWNIEPGIQGIQPSFTYIFTKAGLYQPEVQITDLYGCEAKHKAQFYIRVHPKPQPDMVFSPEEVTLVNNRVKFTPINRNGDIGTCEWFMGVNKEYFSVPEPEFEFTQSGLNPVKLLLTNSHGCKEETLKYIDVKEDFLVYIPNSFTPNEDGLNDVFLPIGQGISNKDYTLRIFDRWGKMIFESRELKQGWDGKVEGTEAAVGIYTYQLFCYPNSSSKLKTFVGSVQVLK